jgi:hypothetical protein
MRLEGISYCSKLGISEVQDLAGRLDGKSAQTKRSPVRGIQCGGLPEARGKAGA